MKIEAVNTATDDKEGENGNITLSSSYKLTASRYMAATESAKAKFREGSPKSKLEGEDSPAKQQKRLSFGSPSVKQQPISPGGTARSKSISQVSPRSCP